VQVYAKAAAAADAKAVERGEMPPGNSDGEDAEHPDSTSASISSGDTADLRRRSSD